jgi:ferredoxin-NADP reductase
MRLAGLVNEGDGVVSVYLTTGTRRVSAEAGQFFSFRFLSGTGWTRAHPYSLSAAPTHNQLRISVKEVGDGSRTLRNLRPGTRVLVEGPYGRLSARARSRRRIALVAAGVGVAPLRALAEGLDYAPGEAVLLYRFSGRPLFEQELQQLARDRGLHVIWLPGRRRADGSWLCTGVGKADDADLLRRWVPDLSDRDVFVCGPEEWAADFRRAATAVGVRADRLHVESFGW